MSRRLAWIGVGGLAISVLSLAIAAWIADWAALDTGGPAWAMRSIGCMALRLMTRDGGSEATDTVSLPWSGGDTMEIDLPAEVIFQPAPKAEVSITGNAELIRQIRLVGAKLRWSGGFHCLPPGGLTVRMSGPAPTLWRLNGAGRLILSGLQQDKLAIHIRGSGRAEAEGQVRELTLDVSGSARADLRALSAESVRARIRGSANTDIKPGEDADLVVAGSALVTVHGHPTRMRSRIAGSSEIREEP